MAKKILVLLGSRKKGRSAMEAGEIRANEKLLQEAFDLGKMLAAE